MSIGWKKKVNISTVSDQQSSKLEFFLWRHLIKAKACKNLINCRLKKWSWTIKILWQTVQTKRHNCNDWMSTKLSYLQNSDKKKFDCFDKFSKEINSSSKMLSSPNYINERWNRFVFRYKTVQNRRTKYWLKI